MWMLRKIVIAASAIGLLPIVLAGFAFGLAWAFECAITEGGLHACRAFGTDIGWLIETLLVSAIPAAMFLLPPAVAIIGGWAVAEVINFFRAGPP